MRLLPSMLACVVMSLALLSQAPAADEAPAETGYYELKPSIVSNLTGGPKYIRCDIQLMTRQAAEIPKIELHSAAVRHVILMLLSGKDGNQLATPAGKESLRKEILEAIKKQLEELTGNSIVNDLYFTAYYVK